MMTVLFRFLPLLVFTLLGTLLGLTSVDARAGRLVLIGGGIRPVEALAEFTDWSGGKEARLLIIPWGKGSAEAAVPVRNELSRFNPIEIKEADQPPFLGDKKERLLQSIQKATGIFFTGGDQNRIMDVLTDDSIRVSLVSRFAAGAVFGGTSAGAAIMSSPMLTGDGSAVAPGLGLLPAPIIVDQHFIRRERWHRLISVVQAQPGRLGIGIDEDTAVSIADQNVRVFGVGGVGGSGSVVFLDSRAGSKAIMMHFLGVGECFDLRNRRPIEYR